MPIAVRVQNISKQYQIGSRQESYRTLRDILAESMVAPFRRASQLLRGQAAAAGDLHETFWALQDISFDVQQGEVVGIIGRNGAGKSTLLKILSRITEPSKGRAEVYGRVGALLEVGTGFHEELTGRENIFLNGAILGMGRIEIDRKFDEIVSFAGVERFVDTPVKHYSSGMKLRLGFSVAAHLEPEILIVDEVLAVGDAQFQKKCIGKMSDVAGHGRTVLFVSHNMVAVQSLCSRVVWLDSGKMIANGPSDTLVTEYLNTGVSLSVERLWEDKASAPGNDLVRLHRAAVRPADGNPDDTITTNTPLVVEYDYWNLDPGACLNLAVHVYDEQGICAFDTNSSFDPEWNMRPFAPGLYRSSFYIPGDLLNDGYYDLELVIVRSQTQIIYMMSNSLVFQVNELPTRSEMFSYHGKWMGTVRPMLKWTTKMLEEAVLVQG